MTSATTSLLLHFTPHTKPRPARIKCNRLIALGNKTRTYVFHEGFVPFELDLIASVQSRSLFLHSKQMLTYRNDLHKLQYR